MPEISHSHLRSIHFRASTLEERYGAELANGEIPEGLSIVQILRWEETLSTNAPSLKKRLTWFKEHSQVTSLKSQTFQNEQRNLTGWIEILKKVFQHYAKPLDTKEEMFFKSTNDRIPFGEILLPWIRYLREKNSIKYFNSHPKLRNLFEQSLLRSLSKIASPSILSFFKSYQKARQGLSYPTFLMDFFENSYVDFFLEFASLSRQLVEAITQWEVSTNLLLKRLELDRSKIELLIPPGQRLGRLDSVELNLSTPHSVDGQVCILNFSCGQTWVYKPRKAAPDKVLEGIVEWLNKEESLPNIRTAKIVDGGTYFWQEHIGEKACNSELDFSDYYKRVGCLGALFLVLGSTDYHFGNLRAFGEHPVLIDNETLFSARIKAHDNFTISGDELMDESLFHTISQGHFLLDSARSFFPRAHSISGVFEDVDYLPVFDYQNPHTIEMEMIEKKLIIKGKNKPFCGSRKADPTKYISEIIQGFSACLQLIRKREASFYSHLMKCTENYSIQFRQLLRPSSFYHSILLQSRLPEHNKDGIDRSLHFEKIAAQYLRSSQYQNLYGLFSQELRALEKQLIPWLHMKISNRSFDLVFDHREDSPLILLTAKEVILERRNRLLSGHLLQSNLKMIEYYYLDHKMLEETNNICPEIYHLLFCYQQHFDFQDFEKKIRSSPQSMIGALSLGKGIFDVLIVFAAGYRVYGLSEFRHFIEKVINIVKDALESLPFVQLKENTDIGAVSGLGSIFLTLYHLYKLLNDNSILLLVSTLLSKFDASRVSNSSFENGLAGYFYSLAMVGQSSSTLKMEVTSILQKLFPNLSQESTVDDYGMANGLAGKIFALCAARKYLNNHNLENHIEENVNKLRFLIENNNSEIDDTLFKGYAGLLLLDSHLRKQNLPKLFDDTHITELWAGLYFKKHLPDYLSAGNAGIAEIYQILEHKNNIAFQKWMDAWEQQILERGKYALTPKYLNPTFYNGSSGIIYAKLRHKHPKVIPFIWPTNH